jgi:hypothetical protein
MSDCPGVLPNLRVMESYSTVLISCSITPSHRQLPADGPCTPFYALGTPAREHYEYIFFILITPGLPMLTLPVYHSFLGHFYPGM